MKKVFLFIFMLSGFLAGAQNSTELGDPNEFNQFVPDKAKMGRGSVMAFDSQNNMYFAYNRAFNPPLDYGGPVHVLKKTGNTWQQVGNLSAWGNNLSRPIITFDNYDTLYLAFFDPNKITVLKFNGTNWVGVGSPRTLGEYTKSEQIHLVFDKNNTPYLSGFENNAVSVQKFNGTNWVNIHSDTGRLTVYGASNFSYSLFASPNDTGVYLAAYIPGPTVPVTACVIRYNPTLNTWDTVGQGKIADSLTFWQLNLLMNSQNQLFLGAVTTNYNGFVYSFNGSAWIELQQARSSGNNTEMASFQFDLHDSLYLKTHLGFPRLLKFTGSGWRTIGSNNIVSYNAAAVRFQLDKNGAPYITAMENETEKLEIYKLVNDTQWTSFTGSVVGTLGINGKTVVDPVISVNHKTGIPYIMYAESGTGASITLWNVSNSKWTSVGSERFTGPNPVGFYDLAFDTAGKTYCIFADQSGLSTVKEFNGSSWVNTGSPDLTSGAACTYTDMDVSAAGTPYVTFSVFDGTKSKAQVKKYTGSSWQTVGSTSLSLGNASYTRIVTSASGTPYIIFSDDSLGQQAVVKKFDGTNWVNLGGTSISNEKATYTSLAIDAHDTVYALFTNPDNGRMVMKKFNGSLWNPVGGSVFNDSIDGGGSVGLDLAGFPYVTFPDPAHEHKASIRWFNGSSWNYLGQPGFSAGRANKPVISFDKNNNLYVAYSTSQAFARKFSNLVTGVHPANIIRSKAPHMYPNPASASGLLHLDIRMEDVGKEFMIYDLQGKLKHKGILSFETNEIKLDQLTNGLYLLRISGSANAYKLLVQN